MNGVNVIGLALQTPSVVPSLAVIRHPMSEARSLLPSGNLVKNYERKNSKKKLKYFIDSTCIDWTTPSTTTSCGSTIPQQELTPLQPRPATIGGLDVVTPQRQHHNSNNVMLQHRITLEKEDENHDENYYQQNETEFCQNDVEGFSKENILVTTISKTVEENDRKLLSEKLNPAISKEKLLCIDLINVEGNEIL